MFAIGVERSAIAQGAASEVCYRIFDLGQINVPTSAPEFFGFGDIEKPIRINENGEIVFTAWDDQGMRRAYLWLPATNYGFPANARIDLGELIITEDPVAATDLNNGPNGLLTVVGARGNADETEHLPYLWQVSGGGVPDHGYLRDNVTNGGGELGANGFAYGVTDFGSDVQDPDPYIVGYTKAGEQCTTGAGGPLELAFRAKWGGGYTPLNPPPGFMHAFGGPGGSSVALDVAKLGDPIAVGYAQQCDDVVDQCGPTLTPMAWDTEAATADDIPKHVGAQARGINYNGYNGNLDIVGFDRLPDGLGDCTQPASFWDIPSLLATSLPNEQSGAFDDERRAEGVSNLDEVTGDVTVVGQNEVTREALAWIGQPGQWDVQLLLGSLNLCCAGSDSWLQLINAIDVNVQGHIVGYGLKGNPLDPDTHYFLLVPAISCTPCCGDTNDDGVVDVADLLAVLAAWGPCIGCPEDIDCNREVETEDLLVVLARWGPCPEQPATGLGMPLETALGALGFSTVQEFRTWAESATTSEVHAMAEVLHLFISPKEGG